MITPQTAALVRQQSCLSSLPNATTLYQATNLARQDWAGSAAKQPAQSFQGRDSLAKRSLARDLGAVGSRQ